jgi:hypothetical protein
MNLHARIKRVLATLEKADPAECGNAYRFFAVSMESYTSGSGRIGAEQTVQLMELTAMRAAINTRAGRYIWFVAMTTAEQNEIAQLWREGKEDDAYELAKRCEAEPHPNQEASAV